MCSLQDQTRECRNSSHCILQVRLSEISLGSVLISHYRECFHPMISTKFRKSLEPSVNVVPDGPRRRPLKASGNLLLGLSGGLGSAVLLNLLSQCYFATKQVEESGKGGKDHPRNTSVWPKAAACYVEICSAFPGVRLRVRFDLNSKQISDNRREIGLKTYEGS